MFDFVHCIIIWSPLCIQDILFFRVYYNCVILIFRITNTCTICWRIPASKHITWSFKHVFICLQGVSCLCRHIFHTSFSILCIFIIYKHICICNIVQLNNQWTICKYCICAPALCHIIGLICISSKITLRIFRSERSFLSSHTWKIFFFSRIFICLPTMNLNMPYLIFGTFIRFKSCNELTVFIVGYGNTNVSSWNQRHTSPIIDTLIPSCKMISLICICLKGYFPGSVVIPFDHLACWIIDNVAVIGNRIVWHRNWHCTSPHAVLILVSNRLIRISCLYLCYCYLKKFFWNPLCI